MRRDMGLIRELLLQLEALPMRPGGVSSIVPDENTLAVPGHSLDEIKYHLSQIEQSGFVDNGGVRPANGIGFRCLTPVGHDFLDTVRDPEIMRKTTDAAKKVGGGSIEFFWSIAKEIAKAEIKRHIGLDL